MYLSAHNVNTTSFVFFVTTAVVPTIGFLYNNYKTAKIADTTESTKEEVKTISHQTNGMLTKRIEDAVDDALKRQQEQMKEVIQDTFNDQLKDELKGGK